MNTSYKISPEPSKDTWNNDDTDDTEEAWGENNYYGEGEKWPEEEGENDDDEKGGGDEDESESHDLLLGLC